MRGQGARTSGVGARPAVRARDAGPLGIAEVVALAAVVLGLTIIVVDGTVGWAVARLVLVGAIAAGLVLLVRRGSVAAAGGGAVVLGLAITPAGVAVTISYARATGWPARATAGLLLLAGGGVLLTVGAASGLGRLSSWWRRLVAVSIGLGLAYVIALPVATAVSATNVGRAPLGRMTPADAGLGYRDVTLETPDGVALSGWYVPSTTGAALVLAHGASSTREGVLDEAVVLAHHGFGVLLYDARGMGRSGGRAMNLGWYGDRDMRAAVDFLVQQPDVNPKLIAAVGESMGGEEAIGAMAADARIRAVVAEGATNRVAGDWAWLSDSYGVRGSVQEVVQRMTTALTGAFTRAPQPVTLRSAVGRAAPRPVLLLAAGKVPDEAMAARYIATGAPSTVQVVVLPGAGHADGLDAQPVEWESRVTAFLQASLGLPATDTNGG